MRFGNSMERARNNLQRDLRAVARDTEALLQATSGETNRKVVDARVRAQESLERMRAKLATDQWLEPARRAVRASDEFAREHPWGVVGAVAGAGVIIGLLLRTTRHSRH